jgi:hypothetical protein
MGRLQELLAELAAGRTSAERIVDGLPVDCSDLVRRALEGACARADVERFTAHGLRRLVAQELHHVERVLDEFVLADGGVAEREELPAESIAHVFAFAVESIGVYLAWESHESLMADQASAFLRFGSYAIGRRWGRHPLSPISPGKTVEGALGGICCAVLVGALGGIWLGWPWGALVGGLLGGVVAVFALVGDLTESMMKRDAGLKDSGDAIPGHGGILDRIDSYLFVPAVVYFAVTLFYPLLQRT